MDSSSTTSKPLMHSIDFLSPICAGIISVVVNYAGSFVLVFHAAKSGGLPQEILESWIWSISIAVGLIGLALSIKFRTPFILAWSTPGAALMASTLPNIPFPEAVGGYVLSGLAFALLALSGYFRKVVALIPTQVAAALLAGILLKFGTAAFSSAQLDFTLVSLLMLVYLTLRRLLPRYAVVGVLTCGLAYLTLAGHMGLPVIALRFASPIPTVPEFTARAAIEVALPLFLVTLTGQYIPGFLILKQDGFDPRVNVTLGITGLGSALMALFGSHAFNISAITAGICTGPDAHENPKMRYIGGISAGLAYITVGTFGATLAAIIAALPSTFTASIAGLGLLGTIASSLVTALDEPRTRESAVITFLVAASNVTVFGMGSVFWAIIAGLFAYLFVGSRRGK
jgi:benzoate membrane transport protein